MNLTLTFNSLNGANVLQLTKENLNQVNFLLDVKTKMEHSHWQQQRLKWIHLPGKDTRLNTERLQQVYFVKV